MGSDLEEFYDFCVEFVDLPWGEPDAPVCSDGWWATFLFQTEFDFHLDTDEEAGPGIAPQPSSPEEESRTRLFDSVVEILYRQLGGDPYLVCETFGSLLLADTADVWEFGKSMARNIFNSFFSSETLSDKCLRYYRNESSSGISPSGFMVFDESERLISELSGQFRNGSDFCNFILSFEDGQERWSSVVAAAVDGAFNIMNDVSLCNSSLHILLGSDGLATFRNVTGYEQVNAFCAYLRDSFNERINVTDFELQLPANFNITTYKPADGEFLPGVTVQDIVSLAGALFTTNKFNESMILACNRLSPLLNDQVFAGLGHFASLCDAINQGNIHSAVSQCEQLLVPQVYGADYPLALRHVDFGQLLLETILPAFNYVPRFEQDVICPAIETVLNSDTSPQALATIAINGLLRSGIEYGAGICQDIEGVLNYLAPDISWLGDPSDPSYDAVLAQEQLQSRLEYQRFFYGLFDFASTLAGFESYELMCAALIDAVADPGTFDALIDLIRERAFSYLTDENECKIAVEATMSFINLASPETASSNLLYQVTGYYSPQAFCIASAAAFRGETSSEQDTCLGILDCAGVCNGEAANDCAGVCGGSAVRDCASVCNGAATINSCNLCVGGVTGRRQNFGQDRCGTCWSDTDYRITWDCHGTCNGTAFLDACKECVGGETGKPANYNHEHIDCRGVCKGNWMEDDCGFCEPFDESSFVANKYMDCNGDCFTPGATSNRAELNQCNVCYGGNTGLNETSGINECGQCLSDPSADESSCAGCDGVPNSGQVNDACGVCGGTGTTCFGVGWVIPNLVNENSQTQLEVYGAGFEESSSLVCIFEDSEGTQTSSATQYEDYVKLTCNVPSLAAGDYRVKVERDGLISDSIYGDLTVQAEINILTVSPSELTINSSVDTITITATAEEGAFTAVKAASVVPSLIIEGDYNAIVQGSFDDSSDSVMYFSIPMPSSSMRVTFWPSLNGVERLNTPDGAGFEATAYAPAPEFTEAYFASTGAAVLIRFSSGVNFDDFNGCEDVFEDTSKLGSYASCRWVGSRTMFIILGFGDNLLAVGDELVIKTDSIKAFRETYSRYVVGSRSVAGPANPVVPTVVLYGKQRITSCGRIKMSGRQTQGGAGRDMVYSWAVSSQGETSALEAVLSGETGADLVAAGSLMDAETIYTFSLTTQNFLGESDTATMNVSRSALAVPEVTITVKGVDPENVFISDSFDLTAEVTFYSDCVPPGDTVFFWAVDNEDIPLNLKTINRRTLHVDPNTLPGDTTVTFTVAIYKSSDPSNNMTQSFSVQTRYSDLIPIIFGGSELTVGRDSGMLTLDGSGSFDPDQVAVNMEYEWLCSQVTDSTACWSYKEGEAGTQFPSAEAAALSVLSIPASAMQADKTYEFTLVVSKLTRSASISVRVTALNGNPPKVDISTMFDERVLSEDSLSLKANIYHDQPLTSYVWEMVGTDEGYAFLDLSDSNNLDSPASLFPFSNSNGSISFLTIKAGKLTAGSTYQVQLTATTEDGQYGIAKVQFTVVSGVTSCIFSLNSVSSYTELETVVYTVEKCVADESAYPLSYRVFLVSGGRRQTVTSQTNDPAIEGVGKAATEEGSSSNTFAAEVCDAYNSCSFFYHTVSVSVIQECSAAFFAQLLEELVTVEKYKQNYVNAFVNFNEVQSKCANSTDSRRRRRSVSTTDTTTDEASEQLSLVLSSIESSVMDTTSAQLLIDQCNYINTADLAPADKSVFIGVLVDLVAVFQDAGETVPDDSASIVLDKATEIRRSLNATHYANVIATITTLTDSLSQAQLSQLELGAVALETTSSAMTSSVQRAIPNGIFRSKSSGGNAVDFGSALASRFSADWACSTGSCSGVTVSFEHWETGQDEFSLTAADQARVAADITDIKLLDPSSGEELTIANLTERISITLSVTLPQAGKTYECHYWDTVGQAWSNDGLETVLNASSSSEVECLTDHLTAFTLLTVDEPTSDSPTVATDQVTDATTSPPTVHYVTTVDAGPVDVPEDNNSSTTIIIVVVCVVVAVALLVVIGAIVIVKAKKKSKVAASDPNMNGTDAEAPRQPEEAVPARPEQWASQRPTTPRRSPSPQQAPVLQQQQQVQVVTVPVALETAPLHSLPPPASPHLVADMEDTAPPPVYIPPTQSLDITLPITDVS
ncbi:uncharacterized protein LOC110988924 [Acanthaster planci]|uniref:Uncharacterized protein LOC110988924 n=1 Tax=Acanthaster planci TaxID=133434 RepID=A0A8B7ZU36_ACAPL|nr:uncharacterized protein LOC110988924 [Acanthaster planci]